MKISKVLLVLVVLVLCVVTGQAQQYNRRTQFNQNPYFINPAYAGTQIYTPMYLSYRNQWTGFENAPVTYFFSTHFSMANNFGGGVNIIRDETGGAISNTQVELTASYSVDLSSNNAFSMGLSSLINQFFFDGTELVLRDSNDPVFTGGKEQSLNFDGNVGLMLYGENYFLGLSIPQFLQSKYNIKSSDNILYKNKNFRHYYLTAMYNFDMTDDIQFTPSVLVKYLKASLPQVDLAVQLKMKDMVTLGIGYRHRDALTTSLGLKFNDFLISYAFDYTISNAQLLSPYTHEVTLGYNIQRKNSKFVKKSFNKKKIKHKR